MLFDIKIYEYEHRKPIDSERHEHPQPNRFFVDQDSHWSLKELHKIVSHRTKLSQFMRSYFFTSIIVKF